MLLNVQAHAQVGVTKNGKRTSVPAEMVSATGAIGTGSSVGRDGSRALPTSTVSYDGGQTITFMAHNLGADTTLPPDIPVQGIHGNYYQWGGSTAVADAYTSAEAISNWNQTNAANNAWLDDSKGTEDPCPTGFKVPTVAQWQGVIANNTVSRTSNNSWEMGDSNFGSAIHFGSNTIPKKLTLPAAGSRSSSNGELRFRGRSGYAWTTSVTGDIYRSIFLFGATQVAVAGGTLTSGYSVRCVSDGSLPTLASVPNAPTIGLVTSSSGQAVVPFTASSNNGGSAITSYTATSNPGGVTRTLNQSGSGSFTVTTLTNGTAYTFRVTATNGVGTSLASAASNSVTPASVPNAPTIGLVTSSSGQAVVPFTAPSNNGGSAITSYTVTSNPGGVTRTLNQSGSGSFTVTPLTNGTAYTFRVTATNGVGTSLASAASNSVIPSPFQSIATLTGSSGPITFMAYNLGADITLSPDIPVQGIHGDYYQWGRKTALATAYTSAAAISNYTKDLAANNAWLDGSKGTEDPCPTGFKVPTSAQWQGVIDNNVVSRTSNNNWSFATTNFGSAIHWGSNTTAKILTLPAAGMRGGNTGTLSNRGSGGFYWSSTLIVSTASNISFFSGSVNTDNNNRFLGFSVRCVVE